MNRRLVTSLAAAGVTAALSLAWVGTASADPNPAAPGQPVAGNPDKLYAAVGADAFAELTNFVVSNYNTDNPTLNKLESFDAVNPVTGATGTSETITTKPGCSGIARPNGANAGLTAIKNNQLSTAAGFTTTPCIDFVRSSRAKNATGEDAYTFYAQSADAVGYATLGNAYAPPSPLTTQQLKDIFECTTTDWSQVGGQEGAIHLYLPPTSAATYTFFLTAIGSSVASVTAGCTGLPTVFASQQNDGTSVNGDPQGITPYAVTKYAAQINGAPGIKDLRGGAALGLVNTTTAPIVTDTSLGTPYQVLNPAFTTGASASFGRLFYNVVRNTAPQELKDVFNAGGYLCSHANAFLIPFGNTPLGNDTNASRYCGQAN